MPYNPKSTSQYGARKKRPPAPAIYHQKITPMLVQDGTKADIKDPKKDETRKYDGSRTAGIKDYDSVQLIGSRNWVNDYGLKHPEILAEVKTLPVDRAIFDCEFTFFKKGTDRDYFLNALANDEKIQEEGVEAKLVIFDVLYVDDEDLQGLPYKDRMEILKTIIPKNTPHIIVPDSVRGVQAKENKFKELEKRKLEGVVLKDLDSPYRQGARTPEWIKVKNWKSDEAIVVGYTKGEGARASTFGSLILAQRDKKGQLHYVGRTAALKNSELGAMLKKMKSMQAKAPQVVVPGDVNVQGWVQPKMVIEVKFLNRTPNGILRMPDFLRERPDKPAAQVKLPD